METQLVWHWVAVVAVLLFPTVATYAYFVLLSGRPSMSILYGASKIVQFAIPLAWVVFAQRRRIALTRPDPRSLVEGGLLGLAIAAVSLAAYFGYFRTSPLLASAPEMVAAKIRDMGLTTPARYLTFALFLAVPHALLEEYYWRWFGFGQLRRVLPLNAAIAVSSLGFMAHHVIVIQQLLHAPWGFALFLSACVAVGGALWAWLYHRRGSLYGPWLSHFLVDAVIMLIGYNLVDWAGLRA